MDDLSAPNSANQNWFDEDYSELLNGKEFLAAPNNFEDNREDEINQDITQPILQNTKTIEQVYHSTMGPPRNIPASSSTLSRNPSQQSTEQLLDVRTETPQQNSSIGTFVHSSNGPEPINSVMNYPMQQVPPVLTQESTTYPVSTGNFNNLVTNNNNSYQAANVNELQTSLGSFYQTHATENFQSVISMPHTDSTPLLQDFLATNVENFLRAHSRIQMQQPQLIATQNSSNGPPINPITSSNDRKQRGRENSRKFYQRKKEKSQEQVRKIQQLEAENAKHRYEKVELLKDKVKDRQKISDLKEELSILKRQIKEEMANKDQENRNLKKELTNKSQEIGDLREKLADSKALSREFLLRSPSLKRELQQFMTQLLC